MVAVEGRAMTRLTLAFGLLLMLAGCAEATDVPQSVSCEWRGKSWGGSGTHIYRIVKVSRDRCEWRRDYRAERESRRLDQQRRDLFRALSTRVLTDDELQQVARYGSSINIENMQPYRAEEKLAELQVAMQMQLILQARARDER
jgi:hypothetical protein